ncbi:hypothetical protein [Salisaeta longa]|uniref:hypothetical protein n=1 Tax=Salisaeta longa TaxID=503170 RepID=UPI0003B5E116|nr:hypothetical protein [Salisaeta longa]
MSASTVFTRAFDTPADDPLLQPPLALAQGEASGRMRRLTIRLPHPEAERLQALNDAVANDWQIDGLELADANASDPTHQHLVVTLKRPAPRPLFDSVS